MKWSLPCCLLLTLVCADPSLAIEVRVRGGTSIEAEIVRHSDGLLLEGRLITDWGVAVPDATLTIRQGEASSSRTTLHDGRFSMPLNRPSQPTTLRIQHRGTSRLAGTEKSLLVDGEKAVTRLSVLVSPNRWQRREPSPVATLELRADGVPLAGAAVQVRLNSLHPTTLHADSRGRLEWVVPTGDLTSAGTHRIQAMYAGDAHAGPAQAETEMAWVATPQITLAAVELVPALSHVKVVGTALLPDADWFHLPVEVLVDGQAVAELLAMPNGEVAGVVPLHALPSSTFTTRRTFALVAGSARDWIATGRSKAIPIELPGAPRAPLAWHLGFVGLLGMGLYTWNRTRSLLSRRASAVAGGPMASSPDHLTGRVLTRRGDAADGCSVVLKCLGKPDRQVLADEAGHFAVLHRGATEGSLIISKEGHLDIVETFQSRGERRRIPRQWALSTLRESMLDQHQRLLEAFGERRNGRRWSPRRSLNHVLRATPHHHGIHREVVALIEAAVFQREPPTAQCLERAETLVTTLIGEPRRSRRSR